MPLPTENQLYSGAINFKQLTDELRMERMNQSYVFDYTHFISHQTITIPIEPDPEVHWATRSVQTETSVPLEYTDNNGVRKSAEYKGSQLNMNVAPIESSLFYNATFEDEQLLLNTYLIYSGAEKNFAAGTSEGPFTTPEKNFAAIIKSDNIDDVLAFTSAVAGQSAMKPCEDVLAKGVLKFILAADKDETLKVLYEQAPISALVLISDDLKIKHLQRLLKYDEGDWIVDGWFQDSSNAMARLVTTFQDYNKMYDYFYANPEEVLKIYYYTSGQGTQVVCDFINVLCQFHQMTTKQVPAVQAEFYEGTNYTIDADILQNEGKTINISNYKTEYVETYVDYDDGKRTTQLASGSYHPMDFIRVVKKSDKGDSQSEEATLLPAIYVKYFADQKEWAEVAMTVRVCADLLVIIITIATLGGASPLAVALGVLDTAMATGDLIVAASQSELEKTPEGREFLEKWNKAMLIASVVTAVPAAFAAGTKLLLLIKNAATLKTVKIMLLKLILEANITNFEKNTVRLLEARVEIVIATKGVLDELSVAKLYEQGCMLVTGEEKVGNATVQKAALIYKGERIAQGTANDQEFINALKQLKDAQYDAGKLLKALEGLLPRWQFQHILSSGVKITENVRKGAYLVGGWVADFQFVLKELEYPVITDAKILEKAYSFPVPQGQKFNLLNVSEDVVKHFAKKGGFFKRVNAPWVDAAVLRKEEIIVATRQKDLFRTVIKDGEEVEVLTGFGKEIHRFEWEHGYRFDPKTKRMLPPDQAKGLPTLTKFEQNKL